MDDLATQYRPASSGQTVRRLGVGFGDIRERFRGQVVAGGVMLELAIKEPDHTERGVTQTRSALDNGIKDWLGIGRRPADNVEHLAGRRLLLQRLAEIISALPQLIKQPRVFD